MQMNWIPNHPTSIGGPHASGRGTEALRQAHDFQNSIAGKVKARCNILSSSGPLAGSSLLPSWLIAFQSFTNEKQPLTFGRHP